MIKALLDFDTDLFLLLNGLHSPWWDTAMLLFTRKETWLMFYLVLAAVIITTYGKKSWLIFIVLVLGLVTGEMISVFLKESIHRLRPGYDPAIQSLTHIVLRKGGLYGFVSSHATNALYVLTFTSLLFRNRISFSALLLWAMLLSYSRIYVGAHFPLDLLGGWLLGGTFGFIFFKVVILADKLFFIKHNPIIRETKLDFPAGKIILLVLVVIVATFLLAVFVLHKYNYL